LSVFDEQMVGIRRGEKSWMGRRRSGKFSVNKNSSGLGYNKSGNWKREIKVYVGVDATK